ncbi:Putative oxidoreductase, molybdopterin-binding domain, oxidoreductase FAD/NAD(P)-binding protein [Septoria linicola]|uniref:Nitrate reductase n=1 Tax=Septoria linicola TaxID=215465 RepID=A0A9Q9AIX1_9PEZI|nr:putative oxidoreductase, molybdopterin-binding domain, oxidoreductase FAD/NAD(P)-binding protein [Septoria linicola]USW50209.1 Putative oxidoreductase, molybdopterin-binding domain, oxidoreductase FAD/NAD(P)-binding protein [Septoria linicola]
MAAHTSSVEAVETQQKMTNFPPTPPDSQSEHSGSDKADNESIADNTGVDFPLPPTSAQPTEVLEIDKKTPDGWLPRDPRLIRLTGVHPFNVEAPLSDLYNEGFLTSPELFYVRNHGHVPQVHDDEYPDWTFSIEGMVENPITLTLTDLLEQYEQHTYPITLVCAGNRRKEQNVVRKTKGFSWGAAGVSTALWTGVVLGDILRKAKPKRGAKYVCMEGADKLPNGYYGTSVKLNWALDDNKGMMLAHKMNGEMLRPDHGKPLRVVIPGQIGGRSVKWLKRLIITAEPSDNWYHIYDNRVLPTMVSPEESANNTKWWTDERYAIYDLSTNSAIAYPAHEEQLGLVGSPDKYRVKGYAYGGGGRRVTRVEISLDKGKTWQLANIDYAEDRYRDATPRKLYGGTVDLDWREASFCWCFWNLDINVSDLSDAADILVRAMDESMNLQPRDMYWSVLGMMNNPWYRITISKEGDYLRFEHPTQPALMPGGWMERVKQAGGNLTNGYWGEQIGGEDAADPVAEVAKEIKMTKDDVKTTITIDDLRKHDKEDAPWFVVNGEVFDGTAFLKEHPGGAQSIISAAGLDSTDEFMAIHSETAKSMMPDYHIGTLDEEGRATLSGETVEADTTSTSPTFLDSRAWKKAVLTAKKTVSWDTRIFTFKLDHEDQTLGLPTGQHLMMRLRDPVTREAIIRSYTPISQTTQKGHMDVLVKVYFAGDGQKGGKMSMALEQIPVGHFVDFKGPIGKFEYLGKGLAAVNSVPRSIKTFYMICGGSGITPIYQVFRAVMQDKADETKCVVLDGNRLVEDILCKADLDSYARDNEDRCKLLYTLTKAPEDWQGLKGRIAAPLLREHADRKQHGDGEAMVLICGPEALEKSCHQALLELGWKDEELLFF